MIPDINECNDEEVKRHCEWGCENTEGSYRCLDAPTTSTTSTTTTSTTAAPEKEYDEEDEEEEEEVEAPTQKPACRDGYRRSSDGKCIGKWLKTRLISRELRFESS